MVFWKALSGVLLLLAPLAVPASSAAAPAVHVVGAFYPVAYAAERVGGGRVQVSNLTPAGAEPHDLELTPKQIDAVLDADVVFDLGHRFQPAVEKAAEQRDGPTVTLLDRLPIQAGSKKVAEATPRRSTRTSGSIRSSCRGSCNRCRPPSRRPIRRVEPSMPGTPTPSTNSSRHSTSDTEPDSPSAPFTTS